MSGIPASTPGARCPDRALAVFPEGTLMKCSALLVLLTVALTSCATDMQVKRLQSFTPRSKTFVFLSDSRWNSLFREALQDNGLKVLRFASRDTVVSKGNDTEVA